MAELIYTGIASLDGCVADRNGTFDWSAPDEDVHAFVNDLERDAGTYLLGQRMYEVLSAWETLWSTSATALPPDHVQLAPRRDMASGGWGSRMGP